MGAEFHMPGLHVRRNCEEKAVPSAHLDAHKLGERLAGVCVRCDLKVLQCPAQTAHQRRLCEQGTARRLKRSDIWVRQGDVTESKSSVA